MWIYLYLPERREQLFAKCGRFDYVQSAPSHDSETLQFNHPNVEVILLPCNTPLILQFVDQGSVKTFNSYYTQIVCWHIMQAIDCVLLIT